MADLAASLVAGEAAVASFTRNVQALRAQTKAAQDALTGAHGTASSPDGAVTVTVDSAGALTRLEFGPAADDRSRVELAAAVLATTRAASADALEQAERRLAAVVGATNPAVELLQHRMAELDEHATATGTPRLTPPDDEPGPMETRR